MLPPPVLKPLKKTLLVADGNQQGFLQGVSFAYSSPQKVEKVFTETGWDRAVIKELQQASMAEELINKHFKR